MPLFRSLVADQRGNTAIIFGLAIVPLIALGGGAVDLSHRAGVRMEMQNAADSAALAAARVLQAGEMARGEDREALEERAEAAARSLFSAAMVNAGADRGIEPTSGSSTAASRSTPRPESTRPSSPSSASTSWRRASTRRSTCRRRPGRDRAGARLFGVDGGGRQVRPHDRCGDHVHREGRPTTAATAPRSASCRSRNMSMPTCAAADIRDTAPADANRTMSGLPAQPRLSLFHDG